jgi:hypothetical protein
MVGETAESRLSRVERDTALLSQRFDDLRLRVTDLAVMASTVIRLEVGLSSLQVELSSVRLELAEREKDAVADRRSNRTAIYGMTTAIIATIFAAVLTLLITSGGAP